MLDEYSLRLLTEIGIDVYVPRTDMVQAHASAQPATANPGHDRFAGDPGAASVALRAGAEILILGHEVLSHSLRADVCRGARLAGLDVAMVDAAASQAIAGARGLIVFGETLARELGAAMPAQTQNGITWVVVADPAALARSIAAKQALWGEIKRLSRVSRPPRRH